jgi:hypothetical protein
MKKITGKIGGHMFDDTRSKKINAFIESISEEIKSIKSQRLLKNDKTNKNEIINYEKFFSESISQFKIIIEKMIMLSTLKSPEKLKNLILLQTIYSIKVLNISSPTSFVELDPATTLYYNTTYTNMKKYYFDLLDECKQKNYLKATVDNELVFTTIQEMILHRYLFYYKTGEISAMIDYIDETFDMLILKNENKITNK